MAAGFLVLAGGRYFLQLSAERKIKIKIKIKPTYQIFIEQPVARLCQSEWDIPDRIFSVT